MFKCRPRRLARGRRVQSFEVISHSISKSQQHRRRGRPYPGAREQRHAGVFTINSWRAWAHEMLWAFWAALLLAIICSSEPLLQAAVTTVQLVS